MSGAAAKANQRRQWGAVLSASEADFLNAWGDPAYVDVQAPKPPPTSAAFRSGKRSLIALFRALPAEYRDMSYMGAAARLFQRKGSGATLDTSESEYLYAWQLAQRGEFHAQWGEAEVKRDSPMPTIHDRMKGAVNGAIVGFTMAGVFDKALSDPFAYAYFSVIGGCVGYTYGAYAYATHTSKPPDPKGVGSVAPKQKGTGSVVQNPKGVGRTWLDATKEAAGMGKPLFALFQALPDEHREGTMMLAASRMFQRKSNGIALSASEAEFLNAWSASQRGGAPDRKYVHEEAGNSSSSSSDPGVFRQKWMWLLMGAMMRTPIIGGLRIAGTTLAQGGAAGPGVAKSLGALLIFLCSVAEFRFDGRDDADKSPKPDIPLEPQPLPHVQMVRERTIPLPKRWECSRAFMHDVRCHRFLEGERLRKAIENGLHETAHSSCVGRDGTGKTRRAQVVRLERVENLALWKQYWHRKYEMIDTHFACNVKVQPLWSRRPARSIRDPMARTPRYSMRTDCSRIT